MALLDPPRVDYGVRRVDRGALVRAFGELEAAIVERLLSWGRPAIVREVLDDLRKDRDLAYTTVITVMDNLHRKGWLSREREGALTATSRSIGRIEGVATVDVDVTTGRVTVHHTQPVDANAVRAAVDEAGYTLVTA